MFVVGLGTGRCGTKSLAELLRRNRFDAEHERKPPLEWGDEPDPGRHFREARGDYADCGFYYLPHVRRLMDEFPAMRFVCLKRDRETTIESFCRVRPSGSNWFSEDGASSYWDRCFPTYGGDFEDAVGRYWDEYYRDAESLECDRFRVFRVEALNCPMCLEDLLRFAGVAKPKIVTGICLTA